MMSKTFEFAERFGFESGFSDIGRLNKSETIIIPNKKRIIEDIKKAFHNRKRYFNPLKKIYTNSAFDISLNPIDYEELKELNYTKIKVIGSKLYESNSENESLQINLKKFKIKLIELNPQREIASYSISFEYKEYPEHKIWIIIDDTETFETLRKAWFLNIESSRIHHRWLEEFKKNKDNPDVLDWLYLNAPTRIMGFVGINQMLNDLVTLLSNSVDTFGTDEETAVIRLLQTLFLEIKLFENIDKELGLKFKNHNNLFLDQLINKKNNVILEPFRGQKVSYNLLQALSFRLDGENYKAFLQFVWNIWKSSSYAYSVIDPTKNPFKAPQDIDNPSNNSGPIVLDYRSNKEMGFHTDNASITPAGNNNIKVEITIKTGVFDHTEVLIPGVDGGSATLSTEREVEHTYMYHLFSPIAILKTDNPTFIYKDKDEIASQFTLMPAFVLLEREKKAFWENIVVGAEYAVDVLTTVSGFGNIFKVGRLFRILKAGHSIAGKSRIATKVILGVKAFAGGIEVTSGTVNGLLKLSGKNDTPLGREISKYLFYLEILSLSTESAFALHGRVLKSAQNITKAKGFAKTVEKLKGTSKNADEIKAIDEAVEHLEEIAFGSKVLKLSGGVIKSTKQLITFLGKIDNSIKAVDLEKVGIKVLFRGTTKNDGKLFKGSTNAQELGLSTSTDPVRAIIFGIESASKKGREGVLQIFLPKELNGIYLNTPVSRFRYKIELEIVVKESANNLSKFVVKEIPIEDARRLLKKELNIDLDTKIGSEQSTLLLRESPITSPEKAFKFYQKLIKI